MLLFLLTQYIMIIRCLTLLMMNFVFDSLSYVYKIIRIYFGSTFFRISILNLSTAATTMTLANGLD